VSDKALGPLVQITKFIENTFVYIMPDAEGIKS
jgi:hypothetical protein